MDTSDFPAVVVIRAGVLQVVTSALIPLKAIKDAEAEFKTWGKEKEDATET